MNQAFGYNNINLPVIKSSSSLQEIISEWKNEGLRIGFVPTMGALHEGHLSLVKLALDNAHRCVVSIFVNPSQFAPNEDFNSYPRDIQGDLYKLQSSGAHLVYTPDENEIYPDGIQTGIMPGKEAQGLETDFRPNFFNGVVNVVYRLFEHIKPDIAIFGEKDFQQLQVISEMVKDLDLDIEILGAPIIRDKYGLAMSSRNTYLSSEELVIARRLNKIIYKTAQNISDGMTVEKAINNAKVLLLEANFDKIDYVEERWNKLITAVWVGKTRLIDNC